MEFTNSDYWKAIILYGLNASTKLGSIERQKEGRHFTDLNEDMLKTIINKIDNLKLDKTWITEDVRNDKKEEWLNILMINNND